MHDFVNKQHKIVHIFIFIHRPIVRFWLKTGDWGEIGE